LTKGSSATIIHSEIDLTDRQNRRWLTVDETAEYLNLHPHGVRKMIYAGKIPAVHVGRAVRVDFRELERRLEEQLRLNAGGLR